MTHPTLAVIGGTGEEGSGLALRWAAAGYPVLIGSRSRERAVDAAKALSSLLPDGQTGRIGGDVNAGAAADAGCDRSQRPIRFAGGNH